MEFTDTYKRPYKMRAQGQGNLNTVVSIPRAVIKREADKRGITVKQFIENYRAIAHYNNFDGVFYAFEEIKDEDKKNSQEKIEEEQKE